jgi:hypothetical protein
MKNNKDNKDNKDNRDNKDNKDKTSLNNEKYKHKIGIIYEE